MALIEEQGLKEKLIWNLISTVFILILLWILEINGVKGYLPQSISLFFISWACIFLFPIALIWKPLAILLVRFMKDTNLVFPTLGALIIFQPLLPWVASETFFAITLFLIIVFASNIYRVVGFLLKFDWFFHFCRKLVNSKHSEKRERQLLKPSNPWYETGLKYIAYFLLILQFVPVFLVCALFLAVFQVFPEFILVTKFIELIVFSSGLLFAIGGVRLVNTIFELYIEVLYKSKVKK